MKREENGMIYINMYDDSHKEYECLGVLMEETDSTIRVAFNACDNIVKDDIIIQKNKVIKLKKVSKASIKIFK